MDGRAQLPAQKSIKTVGRYKGQKGIVLLHERETLQRLRIGLCAVQNNGQLHFARQAGERGHALPEHELGGRSPPAGSSTTVRTVGCRDKICKKKTESAAMRAIKSKGAR